MSGYRPATIKCTVCGVRITGRVDRSGRLYATRHPDNDAPEEPGLCPTHAPDGALDDNAMNTTEHNFLRIISDNPGSAAADLPRAKRGATIKALELAGLIHYGPGGWYITDRGTEALAGGVS